MASYRVRIIMACARDSTHAPGYAGCAARDEGIATLRTHAKHHAHPVCNASSRTSRSALRVSRSLMAEVTASPDQVGDPGQRLSSQAGGIIAMPDHPGYPAPTVLRFGAE